MVQSDVEENLCFSSHSIHVNQYSHQHHTQSENSTCSTWPQNDTVCKAKELNQTANHPQPGYCPHSFDGPHSDLHWDRVPLQGTGFVKSSTIFSQIRTTVSQANKGPGPCPDSTASPHQHIHTSQTWKETSSTFNPEKASLSNFGTTEESAYSQSSTLDCHCFLEHGSKCLNSLQDSFLPQNDTVPLVCPVPKARGFVKSSLADSALLKDKTLPKETLTTIPQDISLAKCYLDSRDGPNQNVPSSQKYKETDSDFMSQSSRLSKISAVNQETIHCPSSLASSRCTLAQTSVNSPGQSPLCQNEVMPQVDPAPQARGYAQSQSHSDSALYKDRNLPLITGLLKSGPTSPKTSVIIPQHNSQSSPNSRSGLDQEISSTRTSKEVVSVSVPQSSSLTTTTSVTQQTIYCQSRMPHSNLCSQQNNGGLPASLDVLIPQEPNSRNNSGKSSSKQSHQKVHSFHESLACTCTQQCVHDPGMTPGSPTKPAAVPQPKAKNQTFARQANLHVTPPSPSPHLLTPDDDPDICQPVAVREEIRLTPQFLLSAPLPPPQDQKESLPQGKTSKSGTPCSTRPLPRATVMAGSPVMPEVEVTGHQPRLTWWVAYNQLTQ